jgi:hypothetical protein
MAPARKRRLARISHEVADGTRYIADESDRWFVGALHELERCRCGIKAEIGGFGRRLAARAPKLPILRSSARERIARLLRKEAARSKLAVPEHEFAVFSERVATLLELILTGSIGLDAIVFELEDAAPAQDPEPVTSVEDTFAAVSFAEPLTEDA